MKRLKSGSFGVMAAVASMMSIMPCQGRQGDAGGEAGPPLQTLLVVEHGTCNDMLVSPKDAELKAALAMLPARLRELRLAVPDLQKIPEDALELFLSVLDHPARLSITNKGFDPNTGMPGIGVVISFKMGDRGEAEAGELHARVERLRAGSPMPFEPSPSKRFAGMTDLPLPMGVLSYGPRKGADGWRYEMIFAAVDDPDAAFDALPKPDAGVHPVMRGSIDLAAWSPLVSMFAGFAAMASPQGQQVMDQFRAAGLVGPDALRFDWTLGHSAEAMQGSMAVRRLGKHAEAWGFPRGSLSAEDFAAIPADATFASVKQIDLARQWANMRKQFEAMDGPGFREGYEQVKSMLGFDPETEVIGAIGHTAGMYFADSTGGGSLLSGVVLMSLEDPAKISGVLEKLALHANAFLREQVEGPFAVEVTRFERDGVTYMQLRAPGLPVFLEPTIAVAGRWMVVGATAQAATAAARHIHAMKPGSGLGESKEFVSAMWALPDGAKPTAVAWVGASRTMRDGYASLTFLSSALANMARTPMGAASQRDPGLVLPVFADLAAGARPMLMQSYWKGDDFITDLRGDRSALVTFASLIGVGDAAPFVGGVGLGAAIGSKAAEESRKRSARDGDHESGSPEGVQPGREGAGRETPY